MTPLARAPWAPERLDSRDHDARVLAASLRDVRNANHWFGGTRSLRRTLAPLLTAPTLTLLDIGTGSGDVVRSLVRWAARRGITLQAAALDLNPGILSIARDAGDDLDLVGANALALPFRPRSFDLVLATLALHHIPDGDQPRALREMLRVARRAVIIAELERSRTHWFCARALAATIWRRNPVTRHDAPVSVLRGYSPAELLRLAEEAGAQARVQRHPFFRLVLTAHVAEPSDAERSAG